MAMDQKRGTLRWSDLRTTTPGMALLYTVETPTGNHRLILTIPFVLYGMFRYLYLIYMKMEGGGPEEVLFRDRPLFGTVVVCTILIVCLLYL